MRVNREERKRLHERHKSWESIKGVNLILSAIFVVFALSARFVGLELCVIKCSIDAATIRMHSENHGPAVWRSGPGKGRETQSAELLSCLFILFCLFFSLLVNASFRGELLCMFMCSCVMRQAAPMHRTLSNGLNPFYANEVFLRCVLLAGASIVRLDSKRDEKAKIFKKRKATVILSLLDEAFGSLRSSIPGCHSCLA